MARRSIKPFPTRITLDYATINGPETSGPFFALLCERDIELIKALLPYARREVAWCVEKTGLPSYYGGPISSEMAEINDWLDDLEGRLMCPICETEITEKIDDLNTAIGALTSCVCALQTIEQSEAGRLPDLDGAITEGYVTNKRVVDAILSPTAPGSDAEKCEFSQVVFWGTYLFVVGKLLPIAGQTADVLVAAIIASVAIPTLASWVGIPVAVISLLVGAFLNAQTDTEMMDMENWLFASKDEIVCVIYANYGSWGAVMNGLKAWLEGQGLQPLEKQMMRAVWDNSWLPRLWVRDHQTNATYTNYIEAGLCSTCETEQDCCTIGACNLALWEHGDVECMSNHAIITGGTAWYTGGTILVPSADAEMEFYWIPYTNDGTGVARASVGLRVVSSGYYDLFFLTPERAPGQEYQESAIPIPSAFWGQICQLVVKQETYWCAPTEFCAYPEA